VRVDQLTALALSEHETTRYHVRSDEHAGTDEKSTPRPLIMTRWMVMPARVSSVTIVNHGRAPPTAAIGLWTSESTCIAFDSTESCRSGVTQVDPLQPVEGKCDLTLGCRTQIWVTTIESSSATPRSRTSGEVTAPAPFRLARGRGSRPGYADPMTGSPVGFSLWEEI
jgi:hypothetical protein